MCLRYPRLYIPGQQNLLFNTVTFFKSLLRGIYVSIVVYFVTHLGFSEVADQDGIAVDALYVFGSAASGILVLIVNFQVRDMRMSALMLAVATIVISPSLHCPSLSPTLTLTLPKHTHARTRTRKIQNVAGNSSHFFLRG